MTSRLTRNTSEIAKYKAFQVESSQDTAAKIWRPIPATLWSFAAVVTQLSSVWFGDAEERCRSGAIEERIKADMEMALVS